MAETVLALRDIVVSYGSTFALRVAAMELCAGEVLAIIGPNGAGKSTLLRVLGLLQRPDAGELRFGGADVSAGDALALRRRIATVFQEPLLLQGTVRENVALGLKLRGLRDREIRPRLGQWLERLGIAHLGARTVRTLSGGEAQRASLARALVLEPELLLLDEPFAALDATSREALLQDFQRIVMDARMTTVFVTHDRSEAFLLADRVGVLHDGRLLQIGGREEVFRHPATEEAARVVGVENRLRGVVEVCEDGFAIVRVNQHRFTAKGRFHHGARVVVCIRPEDLALGQKRCNSKFFNRFSGRILTVSPGMTHQRLTLDCEGTTIIALVERNHYMEFEPEAGDTVAVGFDAGAAHVLTDFFQATE